MKRTLVIAVVVATLAACREKPAESTYGSTSTIPTRTDTTQTSTGGPGAQPTVDPAQPTGTRYGGTTMTDTSTTTTTAP